MITKEQSDKILSLATSYVYHKSLFEYRKMLKKEVAGQEQDVSGRLEVFEDYLKSVTSGDFSLTGKISQYSHDRLKTLLTDWVYRSIKYKEILAKQKPVYAEQGDVNLAKHYFENYLASLTGMVHNPQDAEDEESKS